MNSRRIGLVIATLLAGVTWSRAAHAAISVSASPSPLNMPDTSLTLTSSGTTTLTENGTSSVTIGSVVKHLGCLTAPDLTNTSGVGLNMSGMGKTADVGFSFNPQSHGSQSCQFDIFDNSATPKLLVSVTVTGNGVQPVSNVVPAPGSTLDFGTVPVGGNKSLTVMISNSSAEAGANLHFTSAISSSDPTDYTITSTPNPPADIPPGSGTSVTVTFHPTTTGTKGPATLTIATNDPVSSPQTLNLTGIGGTNQAISISPSPFDYGTVVAGSTNNNRAFAIANTGTVGNLTVPTLNSAQIAGGGGWFVFTDNPAGNPSCNGQTTCNLATALSIAPGTSQNITVACRPPPDVIGTQMATLSINSDAIAGVNMVNLMCTANKPDISIAPASPHDFGNVTVGSSSPFTGIVIGNVGGTTLHYTITRPNGAPNTDYVLTGAGCTNVGGVNTCTSSIASGAPSVTYTVTYTPSAQGSTSSTLAITSDDQDPGDNNQTFVVQGKGVQAFLSAVPANGGTLAFGNVLVGTEAVPFQSVTITNTGNIDMSITSAVLGGTNPGDFEIKTGSSGAQTVTANGGMTSWSLTCKPTSRGNKSATFTVANNSNNQPSYVVNLTCKGTGPHVVASVASIAFGNVREGTTATPQTFTLTNDGETTATFGTSTLLPNNVGYGFSGVPPTLAANGGTATVTVTFSPTAGVDGGPATLTMPSDAVNSPAIVTISGTGQPFGVAVNCPDCAGAPPAMAFGDVRWDQTKPEVFTIANTADSPVQINGIALTEVNDFQLSGLPGSFPVVLGKGGSMTVTVTAAPNDTMLGAFNGKLQVMTDLPSPMMLIERSLTVNSVSPALSVQPGMTVDFGGVDIDAATAKTLTITVQNTGDGPMDITSWPALTGGVFTSAAVAPKSIAAGSSQTLDVSYLPTAEKTAGAGDTVDMIVTIDGLFSSGNPQPTAQKITLKGHGIDRHIQLLNSPVAFPATFDNPTDAESPPLSCDVTNTGEAPLVVSGLMLDASSSPAFMLLDPAQTIAGGATAHFRVAFKPAAPGTNYNATLVLMHDDEDIATPRVSDCMLTGTAISRMVAFMPNTELDLGITGVGVPVRLSDKGMTLSLINMDASHSFAISNLALSGDTDQFTLIDDSNSKTIAPSQTLPYDVEFAPTQAGDFSVTLTVFLDNSPRMQGQITIKGKAVDVEVRGGGCDAAGGGGWGALVLVLAIGLWMSRRRGAAGLALLLLIARPAGAQGPSRDVDLGNFAPAPTTDPDGFQVEGAGVGPDGSWALGVVVDTSSNPLHVESPGLAMEDHPITSRTAFDLGFAYAFGGRYEAGARIQGLDQSGDKPMFSGLTPADGTALGDAALNAKAALVDAGAVGLAASATVTLPTHSSDQFAGAGPSGRLNAILGVKTGRIGANVNAGFRARGSVSLGDIQQGNEVTFGAGASYRLTQEVSAIGELFGQYGLAGSSSAGVSPLEGVIGARYRASGGIDLAAGFGRGLMPGIGAPDYRGFVQITFAPSARQPEPLPGHEPLPPRVVDRGDSDGDGIINSDDKCPTDAEDKDGYQDEDGCPDPDNDADGIPDNVDKCPTDAEDKDGFQDDDGCPDPDNDGDGIPDVSDKCPNEPEDKDGFQDQDGCDDPDNDHDGIPDVVDQCATEPETINGVQDEDGCPDKGDSSVMVQADRIEIFEPVVFVGQTTTIDKKSTNVLNQVAATLRANPEFKRVRVTVHVQPRGGDDEDLTDKRADAVRQWLIKRGIEPERLESKGMGSSRPLVPKGQKGAAAINDRVEFIIMEKK